MARPANTALRLGAHMSTAGGFHRAVERALSVDATALQIFVKSARQWKPAPLDPEAAARFRADAAAAGLAPYTLAHASYLINLAAGDAALRRRSVEALAVEMERCERLGVPGLVLHPGSHVGDGEEVGLERIVAALDDLLPAPRGRGAPRGVRLLLENTAGQGSNLGHRFAHLGTLLREARGRRRLGVCFDTCHALAAGYDFRDAKGYRAMWAEFDREIGLGRLAAFHLNDSKHDAGTRKDRHEHIGRGKIGREGFRRLMRDPRFRGVPMVLETPKGPELDEDRENLRVLRALAAGKPG